MFELRGMVDAKTEVLGVYPDLVAARDALVVLYNDSFDTVVECYDEILIWSVTDHCYYMPVDGIDGEWVRTDEDPRTP